MGEEAPGHLRVSDADRDRVAADLREHFALGRISEDELTERVDAALAARTEADLAATHRDLPQLPQTPEAARAEFLERRTDLRRKLIRRTGQTMAPGAVVIGAWAFMGTPAWFMVIGVLMFGAPLLHGLWALYGPNADLDEAEREIDRLLNRRNRRTDLEIGTLDRESRRIEHARRHADASRAVRRGRRRRA